MKTLLFISSNKMLGQGLSAAIQSKSELGFLWAAQLNYPQAIVGVDIFHADVVILDVVDQVDVELAVEICRSIRQNEQNIKILLYKLLINKNVCIWRIWIFTFQIL